MSRNISQNFREIFQHCDVQTVARIRAFVSRRRRQDRTASSDSSASVGRAAEAACVGRRANQSERRRDRQETGDRTGWCRRHYLGFSQNQEEVTRGKPVPCQRGTVLQLQGPKRAYPPLLGSPWPFRVILSKHWRQFKGWGSADPLQRKWKRTFVTVVKVFIPYLH